MKKKKVYLISFNKLTTEFWKQHLNFENVQLFHWKKPQQGIDNLTTVWPDVIIVDGYFSIDSYENCLKRIIGLRFKTKIFCLTPKPKLHDKTIFIDDRLIISKLDEKVIAKINKVMSPIVKNNQAKLTA